MDLSDIKIFQEFALKNPGQNEDQQFKQAQ
jgi:hypothetical protein